MWDARNMRRCYPSSASEADSTKRITSSCGESVTRDHPVKMVLLQPHQHAQQKGQEDAVLERARDDGPSLPCIPVVATPHAMLCGEIILPKTPRSSSWLPSAWG